MRHMPTIMLILSAPARIIGYALGAWLISSLTVPTDVQSLLALFVPLFLAGLFMLPFLIPFFDRQAKAAFAEHARSQDSIARGSGDGPGATHG
jgi:hypothetical protein